jgi:hypothetical protein
MDPFECDNAGLKRFFECAYGTLLPGSTFVLEAQARESYIKARRLHPVRIIQPSYEDGFI